MIGYFSTAFVVAALLFPVPEQTISSAAEDIDCNCNWYADVSGSAPAGQTPTFTSAITNGGSNGTCTSYPDEDDPYCEVSTDCTGTFTITASANGGTTFRRGPNNNPTWPLTMNHVFHSTASGGNIACGATEDFVIGFIYVAGGIVGHYVIDVSCHGCEVL